MDIEAHISQKGSKQDRSGFNIEDCLQRSPKLSRTQEEEFKTMAFHQGIPISLRSTSLLSSDSRRQEQMLSFSDNKPEPLSPYHLLPPPYSRTSGGGGYGYGGMMMSMQGKGPFTITQWAELEQQALIYKYITANVPVPSSLLISIKKSFYPYGSLPPSSFGWGTFHLGFAGGNMDPEPGRCRRTDGKKWRCSRDAVPDQKYCERHINRGRHRSRKLVEVQSSNQTASKVPQVANKSNTTARASTNNRSLAIGSLPNSCVQNPVYPPVVHQKQRNNDDDNNSFEFGHISSDSLLNPNTGSSSYLDFNQEKHLDNHNPWPEEIKPDWTQLSMSIPITSSSSSQENNNNNKTALSPLRLSSSRNEFDLEEPVKKVNTWIPISWGINSLGGPLGEVLNSTSTTSTTNSTSSPTGVLQKSTFCSLSNNSSSLSSPVTENGNRNNGDYFHYTT